MKAKSPPAALATAPKLPPTAAPRRAYRQILRAEQAEVTRQRILDAGCALVNTLPFDDITLAMVARRAGVTIPTVLRYVGSKEGLLVAGAAVWGPQELSRRDVAPGDVAGAARVLARRYESTGATMRQYLAVAERLPTVARLIDQARRGHWQWLERVFADMLPPQPSALRERRLAQLFTATEIYSWMTWRTTFGFTARKAERALAEHLEALVAAWRSESRGRQP
jgi:AcrR family transcriptional regulator